MGKPVVGVRGEQIGSEGHSDKRNRPKRPRVTENKPGLVTGGGGGTRAGGVYRLGGTTAKGTQKKGPMGGTGRALANK